MSDAWHPNDERCPHHGAKWDWPNERYFCGCVLGERLRALLDKLAAWTGHQVRFH